MTGNNIITGKIQVKMKVHIRIRIEEKPLFELDDETKHKHEFFTILQNLVKYNTNDHSTQTGFTIISTEKARERERERESVCVCLKMMENKNDVPPMLEPV